MFPEMNEEGGDQAANLPMLVAFQEELAESGARSISAATRFQLHLSSQEARAFERRLSGLIDDMMKGDDERREQGSPKHGGIFVLHELADPS